MLRQRWSGTTPVAEKILAGAAAAEYSRPPLIRGIALAENRSQVRPEDSTRQPAASGLNVRHVAGAGDSSQCA
jgi:hypothetical protein